MVVEIQQTELVSLQPNTEIHFLQKLLKKFVLSRSIQYWKKKN